MKLKISRLRSGGLITNYNCPSSCGHCLYACGPGRSPDYISPEAARRTLEIVRRRGCKSVHIGGGEPLLRPQALALVLEAARDAKVSVEYVETNSAWFKDVDSAAETLAFLRDHGLRALLISMSPFHNQYIPFSRVKGVMEACRHSGINILPWVSGFWHELDSFDDSTTHSWDEYTARFGPGYLKSSPPATWCIWEDGRPIPLSKSLAPSLWTTSWPGAHPAGS